MRTIMPVKTTSPDPTPTRMMTLLVAALPITVLASGVLCTVGATVWYTAMLMIEAPKTDVRYFLR